MWFPELVPEPCPPTSDRSPRRLASRRALSPRPFAWALWSAALLVACGSEVDVMGSEGVAGSSTTSTITTTHTGGTGAGGSTGGTTTITTTTTGTGAGGTSACSDYLDEPGDYPLTVRFRNDSGLPIFLPAHCGVIRYDLQASPPDDTHYAFDPFCLQTCEDLQSEGIIDCADCEPTSIYLAPGATLDVPWDGTGLIGADMPAGCWAMMGSGGSCAQQVAAPAGSYRAFAVGYASCGNGGCACDNTGLCYGEATGMEAYSDSVQFSLPTSLVEVVFGPCAFPCPSG